MAVSALRADTTLSPTLTASDHNHGVELGELLTRQFWNDDREVLLKFPALIEGDPKP